MILREKEKDRELSMQSKVIRIGLASGLIESATATGGRQQATGAAAAATSENLTGVRRLQRT